MCRTFDRFSSLRDLTIDQVLLGKMSTACDRLDSPYGPYYPNLDHKLPQSLCRLTIQYVYDFINLAWQLSVIAIAKRCGKFPNLRDIHIVVVQSGTVGLYPRPASTCAFTSHSRRGYAYSCRDDERSRHQSSDESGRDSTPPGESEDYKRQVPSDHPVVFRVQPRFFLGI